MESRDCPFFRRSLNSTVLACKSLSDNVEIWLSRAFIFSMIGEISFRVRLVSSPNIFFRIDIGLKINKIARSALLLACVCSTQCRLLHFGRKPHSRLASEAILLILEIITQEVPNKKSPFDELRATFREFKFKKQRIKLVFSCSLLSS